MIRRFCDKCNRELEYDYQFIYHISASLQSVAGGGSKSMDIVEICEECWKKDFRHLFPTGRQSESYERIAEKFASFKSDHAHDIPAQPELET